MLRRAIFTVTLFVLLSGIPATRADDIHAWTAWLHYGRHMTLVNSAGESLREVDLPLPEGYFLIDRTGITFSHSNELVVYLAHLSEDDGHKVALLVYDLSQDKLILNYPYTIVNPVENIVFLQPEMPIFNETDSRLALVNTDAFTPRNNVWEITILDVKNGDVEYQLKSDDPIVRDSGIQGETWHIFLRSFQDTEVAFTVESYVETTTQSRSYIWRTASHHVRETIIYPSPSLDEFAPTHEIVMSARDNRLNNDGSYCYPENTLQVYDPISHSRFPFQMMLGYPRFVQNGERVLAQDCFGNSNHEHLSLIERDGTVVDEWDFPENVSLQNIKNIPDGFLYTMNFLVPTQFPPDVTIPALLAVNTRDDKLDAGQTIWHLSFQEYAKRAGGTNVPLEIVWEHDDMPPSAYKPWAQLAPPVYEPTPAAPETLPPPTMIPTPEPLFQVGMTVRVQTIGGEILNLRRDHTRKADVIMYLENKMRLTLLEGPIESEGFTWWRIRTADGVEGWTVENNGDLQTLMPA